MNFITMMLLHILQPEALWNLVMKLVSVGW